MTEIFDSSEKLLNVRQDDKIWETLEIKKSFTVPLEQAKLANLRTKCWSMGKKLNKKFRVVQHDNCYEIGRIA